MANFKYTPHEQRAIYAQMQRKKHERDLTLLQLTALVGDVTTMAGSGNILPLTCNAWNTLGDLNCVDNGQRFTSGEDGSTGTATLLAPYVDKIITDHKYRIKFTLSNWSTTPPDPGGFRFQLGTYPDSELSPLRTIDGTYSQDMVAKSSGFRLEVFPSGAGTLSGISIVDLGLQP